MIVIDIYRNRKAVYDILSKADKENEMSNIKGDSWLGLIKNTGNKLHDMYAVRKYLNCIVNALKSAGCCITKKKGKDKSSKSKMNTSQSCKVIIDILNAIKWDNNNPDVNKKMVDLVSKKLKGIKKSTFLFSVGAALDFVPSIRMLNKWGENLPILYDSCIKAREEVIGFSKKINDNMIVLNRLANSSNIEDKSLKSVFNQMTEHINACGGWIFRDCNVDPYNGDYDGKCLKRTAWRKFDRISSNDDCEIREHIYKTVEFIYTNEISLDTSHDCYSDEFKRYTEGLLKCLKTQ